MSRCDQRAPNSMAQRTMAPTNLFAIKSAMLRASASYSIIMVMFERNDTRGTMRINANLMFCFVGATRISATACNLLQNLHIITNRLPMQIIAY